MWPDDRSSAGPLEGIRVLDLTRVLAGPFAAMILGDLGADVLKIERPGIGDETRRWGPPFVIDGLGEEVGAYYYSANRNKRSVEIDLTTDAGRELFDQLCEDADVVLHNYLPRVSQKLRIEPHDLRARHQHLILACITGFGTGNEHENRPGFDFVIQAMSGLMSVTGQEHGDPTKVGVAISDLTAGLYATIGVLAAIEQRHRTDEGQYVEISLLESQVSLLTNQAMNYLLAGQVPGRLGNAHPNIAPYETYATADRILAIGVGTDEQFSRLATALERPDLLEDPRYATNSDRVTHRVSLKESIEGALRRDSAEEWVERFWEAGVPCGPVHDLSEVFSNPLVEDLLEHVDGVAQVRTPFKFDFARPTVRMGPPSLGEHNKSLESVHRGNPKGVS